jgi:cation:H+ antiporter
VGIDLHLSLLDGALLFAMLGTYLVFVWRARHSGMAPPAPETGGGVAEGIPLWRQAAYLALGLLLVAVASHFLIGSATALARSFGVSDWAIAVTVVAAGTSVPELATTIAGVARGHMAISAGNVIGSDIFNVLGVLGVAGIVHPMALDPAARASLLALTAMVVVVMVMMRSGWRVSRLEGATLVMLAALRWVLDLATHQ